MTVLASDNFNRADGGLGANWTNSVQNTANPQIVSNQVEGSATNSGRQMAFWNAVTWPNDQYAQVKVVEGAATNSVTGSIVRQATAADTVYYCDVGTGLGASAFTEIAKVVTGTITVLVSGTVTFNANDTLRLTVQGSNLNTTRNGAALQSTTDSAIASGSAGLWVDPDFGSVLTDSILDDWQGGNLISSRQRTLRGAGL